MKFNFSSESRFFTFDDNLVPELEQHGPKQNAACIHVGIAEYIFFSRPVQKINIARPFEARLDGISQEASPRPKVSRDDQIRIWIGHEVG